MSKVTKVENGDYTIKVQAGQQIILDTARGTTSPGGYPAGTIVVRGSLEVEGQTTTVESQDTIITDNIITLNNGQSGSGISVSKGQVSGIEIDRGSAPTASILFDETITWTKGGDAGTGTFKFVDNTNEVLPLLVGGIETQGATLYVDTGNNVISVTNTNDYEEGIFTYSSGSITDSGGGVIIDDDNIPNTKAVVDYVAFSLSSVFQARIEDGTVSKTFVEAKDNERTGNPSVVEIGVDGNVAVSVSSNSVDFGDIVIQDNFITTTETNSDLELRTSGTGVIKVEDILEITTQTDPSAPSGAVRIYNKTEDTGGTGIFFVNKESTTDELISKSRAIFYSMLF